ncbi:hypothetical protein NDU88_000627 [Pleurodeles waltl]|uniref:ribonuclease H n=1 Tax=Pleurodeles waltl TaxID=8319 RepID=A0AAV7S7J0_PLEWA|nr:hypothetical protein NDU88_000627 [Pleurodeles waltl]
MPVPSSSNGPQSQHTSLAPSPINFSTFTSILKGYPRTRERKLLFRGFSEGFRIPYSGPPISREANHLRSAMEAQGVVQEKLEKERQFTRVAGPFTQPPLPNFIVLPLGIVPKKEQGKYRLIHHLSFPRGQSVNDYLEEGKCSVCYASFDERIALGHAAGKGALMAKADIESAFRLLPVHPSSFHLLGMQWAGQYFYDKCMPMGCAVSCSLFKTFACFLEWALKENTPPGSSLHYLDDFLFIGRAGSEECRETLEAFEHLSQTLGVPLAPGKTQGPTACLTFLDIEIDSTAGLCRPPEDKVMALQANIRLSQVQGMFRQVHISNSVMGNWGRPPTGDKGALLRPMGEGQRKIARIGLEALGGDSPFLKIEGRGRPDGGFPVEGCSKGMGEAGRKNTRPKGTHRSRHAQGLGGGTHSHL